MPLTATDFTTQQRQFLRAAADLVAPGMTDAQVVAWVNQRAIRLVSEEVRRLIIADLREQHNASTRGWDQQFRTAFPDA